MLQSWEALIGEVRRVMQKQYRLYPGLIRDNQLAVENAEMQSLHMRRVLEILLLLQDTWETPDAFVRSIDKTD